MGEKQMKLLDRPIFQSKISSANTQMNEKWLGYFMGPCLLYMVYYGIAGTYLTQFYTDVLHMTGIFLTLMPVFSKVLDAITNVVMGRIIDKTHTSQGKARPWILLSGVLIAITGVMLYAVPNASKEVQILWIVFSYNLFFALAFTIYNMAHTLMVPLSTRNTKQRDTLALLTSTATTMIPGMLVTIIMPIMIASFGVGENAKGTWLSMMSILSILAIPATLLEYYFTKERVTEESVESEGDTEQIPFAKQMKACIKDPYWMIVMGFWILYQIQQNLMSNSMLYFCNWVLGTSISSGTANQVLVNMVGQAPLGIGVVILWPLVHKFGKRRVMMFGFAIGFVGCLGALTVALSGIGGIAAFLGFFVIRSVGLIPTYVLSAQLAEALDHIEWTNHFRADGFSAAIYSIAITVCAGISQTILLAGINGCGYIAPDSASQVIVQPIGMKIFFAVCFVGVSALVFLIGSLLMIRFDVEDKMPQISADLIARRKAEAEARGEAYLSPEEKAAIEQEEQDRIAEEKRIEELKAFCAKKGLSFEIEEQKYQKKLAQERKKAEEKAARKATKKVAKKR